MIDAAIMPLKEHFSALDDPRAQHSIEHLPGRTHTFLHNLRAGAEV